MLNMICKVHILFCIYIEFSTSFYFCIDTCVGIKPVLMENIVKYKVKEKRKRKLNIDKPILVICTKKINLPAPSPAL
jgi:hypothetical protein